MLHNSQHVVSSPEIWTCLGAKFQSLRWMDVALPPQLGSAPCSRTYPHTPRCTWGVTTQLSPRHIQGMSLSPSVILVGSHRALLPPPTAPQPQLIPCCLFWKVLAAFWQCGNAFLFPSFNQSG